MDHIVTSAGVVALALPLLIGMVRAPREKAKKTAAPEGEWSVWLDGREVVRTTGDAPQWSRTDSRSTPVIEDVFEVLEMDDRVISQAAEKLLSHGQSFEEFFSTSDGRTLLMRGDVDGLLARLDLRPATTTEARLHGRLAEVCATQNDARISNARADHSPMPAYETEAGGLVTWYNDAAAQLLRVSPGNRGLRAELPVNASGLTQLRCKDGTDLGWTRITRVPGDNGRMLTFVQDAEAEVRAEVALKSFVATLTETFAQLDVALAIFDRERKLSLFNPALTDLFGLDPANLAARPSLRAFLDALRERRMVPEEESFTKWRRRLTDRSTADGSIAYQEDWTLASGQTLRVTGRPHPKGAVAYVFEDISGHILLERRYLAEIELGQATLDRLREGVAVISKSGTVVFSNAAFDRMWDLPGEDGFDMDGLEAVLHKMRIACLPSKIWQEIKEFVLRSARNEQFGTRIFMHSGGAIDLRLSALPDGSSLLTTSDMLQIPDELERPDQELGAHPPINGYLRRQRLTTRLNEEVPGLAERIDPSVWKGVMVVFSQTAALLARPGSEVDLSLREKDSTLIGIGATLQVSGAGPRTDVLPIAEASLRRRLGPLGVMARVAPAASAGQAIIDLTIPAVAAANAASSPERATSA